MFALPIGSARFEGVGSDRLIVANRRAIKTDMSQRSTVNDDLANLPTQTAQSFASFKTKTDKDLTDLSKMVDEVATNL